MKTKLGVTSLLLAWVISTITAFQYGNIAGIFILVIGLISVGIILISLGIEREE